MPPNLFFPFLNVWMIFTKHCNFSLKVLLGHSNHLHLSLLLFHFKSVIFSIFALISYKIFFINPELCFCEKLSSWLFCKMVGTQTLDFQPFCGHQISCIGSKHVSVVQVRLDYRITQTFIYSGDLKSYPSNTKIIKKLGFLKVFLNGLDQIKILTIWNPEKNGIQNLASLEDSCDVIQHLY